MYVDSEGTSNLMAMGGNVGEETTGSAPLVFYGHDSLVHSFPDLLPTRFFPSSRFSQVNATVVLLLQVRGVWNFGCRPLYRIFFPPFLFLYLLTSVLRCLILKVQLAQIIRYTPWNRITNSSLIELWSNYWICTDQSSPFQYKRKKRKKKKRKERKACK